MSAPLGRREFFALEAGEYLERLALLVTGAGPPDAESLVRYARALRGAALMAGPPGYAVAAAALENVAKALREGSVTWSPALGERLSETIETGKHLLRRVRDWSEEDIARCERAASGLTDLAGAPVRRSPAAEPAAAPTQSAAVRAYIARETASLAATLEQAADAVEPHFRPDSLATVIQRLQPLRGLGSLPGLSPLPELLEALDLTLAHGGQQGAWPPGAARAFRATAAALGRMARDIAELGIPQQDSPELLQAAELLREAFAGDQDVVPVASLFAERDPQPIARRGTPPARRQPVSDVAVELVGLADRLRHAATQLRVGPAGPARGLQLYCLVFSIRGLALSPATRAATDDLFDRLDRETMTGRALAAADRTAELFERTARALAEAAETGAVAELAVVLMPFCEELDCSVPEQSIVAIETLAPEASVVPIASLAPEEESEIVPIESLGYDAEPARAPHYLPFEQTFSTYYRLLYSPAPVPVAAPTEPEPVPIQALIYRGRRALERADLVRRELDAALRTQRELAGIRSLLGELLDLVPLALDDER